jgi:hypothetical protein
MLRALVSIGILVAGQAQALTPIPECVPDGAERAAGVSEYSVSWHGNGFALYSQWSDDYQLVLDDCEGQRRLLMTAPKLGNVNDTAIAQDLMFNAVFAALESRQRYTMGQIQAIARKAGAKTTLGAAGYVSCACERWGNEG